MLSIMHGRRLAVNSILLTKIGNRFVANVAVASSTSTASTPNASKKNTSTAKDADNFNGLVLGVYERTIEAPKLTVSAKVFDQQVSGGLHKLIKDFNLCGSSGTVKLFHNFEADYGAIALVGLGPQCIKHNEFEARDQMMENVRIAAALGCDRLQNQNCDEISIDDMGYPEQAAEGGILSIWKYQEHLKEEKRSKVPYLDLYQSNEDSREQFISGIIRAEAQNMCRYMCEMPGNQLTPDKLAKTAVDLLCPCGVNVDVRDSDWIQSQKMNAFLMVARSSSHDPKFLEINYTGGKSEAPILLVGKGLTYNNGGLCLKRNGNLAEYRADMCGAAILISAIRAAAGLQLPLNITGLIPICENVVSRMAIKPGDVAYTLNGINIMAENTDLSAILTLADTLVYGVKAYKAKNVISIGASSTEIRQTFGEAATPIYSNSDCFLSEMAQAACVSGDRIWKMPNWQYFSDKVSSHRSVDLRNQGDGNATSCKKSALFNNFLPNAEWLHMDVQGVGMLKRNDLQLQFLQKDLMTGRPTRTLIQFLCQLAEKMANN